MKNIFNQVWDAAQKFVRPVIVGLAVTATLCVTECAQAQGMFDYYNIPTPLQIDPQANYPNGGAYTNAAAAQISGYIGYVSVYIPFSTNIGSAGAVAIPQVSADTTNWFNITNYAISTQYSVVYTNVNYGTNAFQTFLTATNIELLPGTKVTPVASTAGFATPYLNPAAFTNSGALTLAPSLNVIGFNISDQNFGVAPNLDRYFRVVVNTNVYASTNYSFSATLMGRRRY